MAIDSSPHVTRELLLAWADDLDAHPELQGRYRLRGADDRYCCLGRLAELAGCTWVKDDDGYFGILGGVEIDDLLPLSWIDSLDRWGLDAGLLAGLNDTGTPWSTIAEMIRGAVNAKENDNAV